MGSVGRRRDARFDRAGVASGLLAVIGIAVATFLHMVKEVYIVLGGISSVAINELGMRVQSCGCAEVDRWRCWR